MRFWLPTRSRETSSGVRGSRLALVTSLLGFGTALLLASGLAQATSLELEGTADLTEKSNTIVTGRVVSTEARMKEEHQFIYTYVTIEVDDVLKGNTAEVGSTIVLEELGGRVGPWIHQVHAVPHYEAGERVLAFLEDREGGLFRTYGMIQGKFRFEPNTRTGEEMLTRPAEWTDAYFAASAIPRDLTVVRADGSYAAEPLVSAIRDWVAQH
ncbi:MAG: hypothetical protein R3E97_13220 [Candidatus Eisenbacteria bacterium]